MKNTILQSTKVIVLGLILSAGIAFAQTWTGPTSAPPGGNVAAPINVGATSQIKSGAFGTGPLAVFGNSALYGDVSILGSNIYNNTSTGFLQKSGLLKKAFAQNQQTTSNLFVSGNVTVGTLASSTAGAQVCASTTGQLTLCTVSPTPTPPPPSQPHGTVVFPGTPSPWSVPAGVTSITVEVWGGGAGGGGGGGSSLNHAYGLGGGGGGAGGYSKVMNVPVTQFELFTVAVGAGGAGGPGGGVGIGNGYPGTDGSGGGTTTVTRNSTGAVLLTASGGTRGDAGDGTNQDPGYVGTGGAGGSGTIANGGNGTNGGATPNAYGGSGGSAPSGGSGGSGGASANDSTGGPGSGGTAPGAGGGGGAGGNAPSAGGRSGGPGGNGAIGRVVITY